MAGNGGCRKNDELLAAAVAAGRGLYEAAAELGISERTASRRNADAAFRRRVAEFRAEMLAGATGELSAGLRTAVAALRAVIDNGTEQNRLKAAKVWIDAALKTTALIELETRIRILECQNERKTHES